LFINRKNIAEAIVSFCEEINLGWIAQIASDLLSKVCAYFVDENNLALLSIAKIKEGVIL